jgi:phosphatidylserine/phosphatidylglycerophosphate/cardiolipin synthase-like enzyme
MGPPMIKRINLILIVSLLPCLLAFAGPEWQVYFSPTGGCTDAIMAELGKATNRVLVQAYSFTSAPIANALVAAHDRGVMVTVILDKGQKTAKGSLAGYVSQAGITTRIDTNHAIAHNKVMVIDGLVVITGSFNFSKAAEKSNAENLLIIRDKELAGQYITNWHLHEAHSAVYQGK